MKKTDFVCTAKKDLPRSPRRRAEAVNEAFVRQYPDAECMLDYGSDPFRLLVMARLSAQCTDKRVNEVAPVLFAAFPDAASMAAAPLEKIEEIVRPCGLYRTKAKSIRDASRVLIERYGGRVPSGKEELLALPGVGEKIANLMLGDVFGDPQVVADTHCIRIAGRLGLATSSDPSRTVRELEAVLPKEIRSDFCHRIVDFGREFCRAQSPRCESCPLRKKK